MSVDFILYPPIITNFGVFKGGPQGQRLPDRHYHCPVCHGKATADFSICPQCGHNGMPLVCTPFICASS
jgi:hypothetical protein